MRRIFGKTKCLYNCRLSLVSFYVVYLQKWKLYDEMVMLGLYIYLLKLDIIKMLI